MPYRIFSLSRPGEKYARRGFRCQDSSGTCIKNGAFYNSAYNDISSGFYFEIRSNNAIYFNTSVIIDISGCNIYILKLENIGNNDSSFDEGYMT